MRLLAALLAAALPLASPAQGLDDDDDFEADRQPASVALGPSQRGGVTASVGVGWLRSDVTLQLGLGWRLDLILRGDAMALYDGFNAQNTVYAGIRISPFDEGIARLGFTLEGGEIFIPTPTATKTIPVVRGEVAAGVVLAPVTVYGRLALRGLSGKSAYTDDSWSRDTEAGLGVEGVLVDRLVLGAEVYAWARPEADTLWNWRLRVGWSM